MTDEPLALQLWRQANGETDAYDQNEYRRLLVEHGVIPPIGPGELARPLPDGWPEVRYPEDLQWLETAHLTQPEQIEALGPKPWRVRSFEDDDE